MFIKNLILLCASLLLTVGTVHNVFAGVGLELQEAPNGLNNVKTPSKTPSLPEVNPGTSKKLMDCKTKIHISGIKFVGNKLISSLVLTRLTEKHPIEMSMCDLHMVTRKITDYYHNQGFLLSFAVIPPQDLKNGIVVIRVIEGKLDQAKVIHNKSLVSTKFLQEILDHYLHSGEVLKTDTLAQAVYNIQDISSGVGKATASPGQKVETSNIFMDVSSAQTRTSGSSVTVDDYGNPYTGAERLTGTLNLNSLTGLGDQLAITTQVTGDIFTPGLGAGMEYAHINYTVPVTTFGTRIGFGATALNYRIIDPALANIMGTGNGVIFTAFINQTLLHNEKNYTTLNLEYDHYVLSDIFGSGTSTLNDNRNLDVATATLAGTSNHNGYKNLPLTINYSLSGSAGNVGITNAQADTIDSGTLKTGGLFFKGNAMSSLLAYVSNKDSVFTSLSGQLASKNLDPSMQYILGGPESVSAYAEGLFAGDQGFLAQFELRHDWIRDSSNNLVTKVFYDEGYIEVNRFVLTNGINSTYMGGPGVGVEDNTLHWTSSLAVSIPVGNSPSLVSNNIPGAVSFNPSGSTPIEIWLQVGYKW